MTGIEAEAAALEGTRRRNPLLAQRIRRDMMDAIVEQRLRPGTHLPEEELAAIYSATRRQIAKVLQSLATDELVELNPNRGAFVARPTWTEAREIIELRRVVEAHVVKQLAASPTLGTRLARALDKVHPRRSHRAHDEAVRHSGRFHVVLAECAGNQQIARLVQSLVARSSLVVELYGNITGLACWIEEHASILDHIAAADAAAASRAMELHLCGLESSLLEDKPNSSNTALSTVLGPTKPRRATKRQQ